MDATFIMIFIAVWQSARKKWRYDFKLPKKCRYTIPAHTSHFKAQALSSLSRTVWTTTYLTFDDLDVIIKSNQSTSVMQFDCQEHDDTLVSARCAVHVRSVRR